MKFSNEKVLIFGGTGSLGKTLVKRFGGGKNIHVFSRDEAKHHRLLQDFPKINSIIGNIRDYDSVLRAISVINPGIIINCSAMKQVPACEFYPYEAVMTNVDGTKNIVKAVGNLSAYHQEAIEKKILSISTDKACKPVNSYGFTKALQERIHLNENDKSKHTYSCVRYGNVLESTGSVIPVFKKMASEGKSLTVTDENMTRFFLSLDQAVDLIVRALRDDQGGKIFIPKVPAAKITDLAAIIDPASNIRPAKVTGIRPGEKLHEILVSEEELMRTEDLGDVYVIHDIKNTSNNFNDLKEEYSSNSDLMTQDELRKFLKEHGAINA